MYRFLVNESISNASTDPSEGSKDTGLQSKGSGGRESIIIYINK